MEREEAQEELSKVLSDQKLITLKLREAIHKKKVMFLWTLSVPHKPPPPPQGLRTLLGGSFLLKARTSIPVIIFGQTYTLQGKL